MIKLDFGLNIITEKGKNARTCLPQLAHLQEGLSSVTITFTGRSSIVWHAFATQMLSVQSYLRITLSQPFEREK